jgi:hypothetical protein
VLRRIFGVGKGYDGWREFARQAGGEVIDRGFVRSDSNQPGRWQFGPWIEIHFKVRGHPAILETLYEDDDESVQRYTSLRVTLPLREPFRLEVSRERLLGRVGKVLGMEDLHLGHPDFDGAFLIKTSNERAARSLLDDEGIRQRLLGEAGGAFGLRPADVSGTAHAGAELYFEEKGLILEVARLTALSRLVEETVDRAERLGLLRAP